MTLFLVMMMTHWICRSLDHVTVRLLLAASLFFHPCASSCYFPAELQGEFTMQSTAIGSHQVQYSHVTINAEAIPIWGHCHRRIGLHHAILKDSSGVQDCIRCFFLNMRSRNILQVYTEGLAKCYTSEEAAEATCPQESRTERSDEILLYKTKDLNGDPIPLEFCPFGGRFTFTYDVDDGSESKVECPSSVSELHTCPSGSAMGLRFRRCSFDDHNITFQCLGDWQGPGKQRYLALLDTRQEQDDKPRYRCALYRTDESSGNMELAFSSDSTCRSDLHSSVSGFETLGLRGVALGRGKGSAWPTQRWPLPLIGKWQHLDVTQETIIFRDHDSFKTYVFRSIAAPSTAGRFLVYGQTLCGEEFFTCLWIKERSFNVLEFQMGLASRSAPNESLCSDSNFIPGKWNTQGRVESMVESPCPIPGEYTGEIPDVKGLCARMWSHCNTSEMMHYTVADCYGQQVYEGRRQPWNINARTRQTRQREQPFEPGFHQQSQLRYPTSYRFPVPAPVPVPDPYDDPYADLGAPYDPWEFAKTHASPPGGRGPGSPGGAQRVSVGGVVVGPPKTDPHMTRIPVVPGMLVHTGSKPGMMPENRAGDRNSPEPVVREEREYRCLGQWEEDGRVYTYTRRNDVPSYECFVGKIVSETSIFMKEAGPWCQRQVDPMENGMEVTRRGPCHPPPPPLVTRPPPPPPVPSRPQPKPQPARGGQPSLPPRGAPSQHSNQAMPEPTKPWKPITGRPQQANAACRSVLSWNWLLPACHLVICMKHLQMLRLPW